MDSGKVTLTIRPTEGQFCSGPEPPKIAQWMLAEIEEVGVLLHIEVVEYLRAKFGADGTYINSNGHPAISKPILAAFHAITGDKIVWVRAAHYWRKRRPGDDSDRQQ